MIKFTNLSKITVTVISALLLQTANAAGLEEIIVTAQKRQESLQDVSIAVTAIGGDDLSSKLIDNVEDIQALAPNVSVGHDFAIAKLFIRGIGLSGSFAGIDPSVALHVDGAVISQSYAQLGSFFDLERVEILRGPQGTLYGRNATGGTFNLITRKPTEEFEGYGRLSFGNYDKVLIESAVSGPISDDVRGRVAFRSDQHSGYGRNIVTGGDVDDANKQSVRGQLHFDINDNANLLLSAEWSNEDDASLAQKFIATADSVDPTLASAPGAGGFAPGIRDIASEVDARNDRQTWAINAALDWSLNEEWSLKSITNYRDVDVLLTQDLDISSNVNDDVQNNRIVSDQFSQEFQLTYESDRLRGLIGLYYFDESVNNRNNIGFASAQAGAGNTSAVLFLGDINAKTLALFTNFSYELTSSLIAKIGARYTREDRDSDNIRSFNFSHFGGSPFRVGCVPETATAEQGRCKDDRSFNDFSPLIGLDWHAGEDLLIYGSYSEGFKAGTIQGGQVTPILEPETIENYEIGLKGTFFGNQLQLNVAGFYYDISDLQVDRTSPNSNGGFSSIFENASEAEGQGLDLEVKWLASENLKINGHVGILDTEFGDFITDNPLDNGVNLQNLAGNSLRQAPELSWGLGVTYDIPLSNGGTVSLGVDASYKDEQFYTEFNQEITGEDDYTLVNARINYTSPNERLNVTLWGKNLSDEDVYSGKFVIATGRTISGSLLPPLTTGVTVGYDF